MSETSKYFVRVNDEEFGPFSLSELQRQLDLQNVVPTDLVRRDATATWMPLSQMVSSTRPEPLPGQQEPDWAQKIFAGSGILSSPESLDKWLKEKGATPVSQEPRSETAPGEVHAPVDLPKKHVSPDTVLVSGDPSLTEQMVQDECEFFRWVLDLELSDRVKADIREEMISTWNVNNREGIETFQEHSVFFAQGHKVDPVAQQFHREYLLAQLLSRWRKQAQTIGALSLSILKLYDENNPRLAQGEPPLTRKTCDAFAQWLAFRKGVNDFECRPRRISSRTATRFANRIALMYPSMKSELREKIAGMPLELAKLRVDWLLLSDGEKFQLRNRWLEEGISGGFYDFIEDYDENSFEGADESIASTVGVPAIKQ